MVEPLCQWVLPREVAVDADCVAIGVARGISGRMLRLLAARGVASPDELRLFLADAEAGLHDPRLLPDAEAALLRVSTARARGERILVYGDFDADGLTGLSILVIALRRLGLDAAAYAPERLGDGHGLSLRAIETAVADRRTLIVTADCGTSSGAEIEEAARRGIDVVVTDHHHAATWPSSAVAVVNPQRGDSAYPDRRLTGAGVAWKFAQLLLNPDGGATLSAPVRELADLAIIGTVADVAPILGENRSIARIGLEQLRRTIRPGLLALFERAGIAPGKAVLDDIGFAIAPRLNAAGRMGEAARAARLLLAEDGAEAGALADEIEAANTERRGLTKTYLAEARLALGLGPAAGDVADAGHEAKPGRAVEPAGAPRADGPAGSLRPALLVRGDWPVGLIGLIAGRLADETGRPTVVASPIDPEAGLLRASCRGPQSWSLAEALVACEDLLVRHGGHAAAAGFDIEADRWPEFERRFLGLAAAAPYRSGRAELILDIVMPATEVEYGLVRELEMLEPTGPGNPAATLGLTGLKVVRARSASGGHTQLVLGRGRDVLDAVAFRRPDLATSLREGDRIDVVARAASRRFGGFESIQLEVLDVASEGALAAVASSSAATGATASPRGLLPA
jgi:single-stranded-DNA-specific exonuclease